MMYPLSNPAGSISSPYEFAALPTSGPYVGHEVYVVNTLVPWGAALFYWNGVKYQVSPEQVLIADYNADGSPLVELIATGLTPGTAYEGWVGTKLVPDWMWANGFNGSATAVINLYDTGGSTANSAIGVRISDAPYVYAPDFLNMLNGVTYVPNAAYQRVSPQVFTSFQIRGDTCWVSAAGIPTALSPLRQIPVGSGATRKVRLTYQPGAVTNIFRFYSFTMKSGVS